MKRNIIRGFLIGVTSIASVTCFAGGIEVEECCTPTQVTLPKMPEGWGFTIEGAAILPFNNNLNYEEINFGTFATSTNTFEYDNDLFKDIRPGYAFQLTLGVDYTLENSGNVVKLFYEHLFTRTADNDFEATLPLDSNIIPVIAADASLNEKLDGVTLLSEQHIMIGSNWETTISGGMRFAHLMQELQVNEFGADICYSCHSVFFVLEDKEEYTMQYNGVGPLIGFSATMHAFDNFSIGGQAQGAILVGRNNIDFTATTTQINVNTPLSNYRFATYESKIDSILSIVPEMYYRLYGNYVYQFRNNSELTIEAGWRGNQFFNVRTFVGFVSPGNIEYNETTSEQIGFSGPYLMLHYKI
jgi:hypothetical protein